MIFKNHFKVDILLFSTFLSINIYFPKLSDKWRLFFIQYFRLQQLLSWLLNSRIYFWCSLNNAIHYPKPRLKSFFNDFGLLCFNIFLLLNRLNNPYLTKTSSLKMTIFCFKLSHKIFTIFFKMLYGLPGQFIVSVALPFNKVEFFFYFIF